MSEALRDRMKHFELYELVDHKTFETEGEDAWQHFDPDLLIALDSLREFFGLPVTVNNWHSGGTFQFRGFRPEWYQPGITPGSAHRKGKAIDCDVQGYSAHEARKIISENKNNPLLTKIMRMEADVTWLHFDLMNPPEGKERIYLFHV